MVILLGQSNRMAPRDIAKQVRPLIGLNERQAAANLNYREKVYDKYREQGMGEIKAREVFVDLTTLAKNGLTKNYTNVMNALRKKSQ